MMNVIAAFFCGQAGINFASYSLTFMFLNAWAFLPCCLAWDDGPACAAVYSDPGDSVCAESQRVAERDLHMDQGDVCRVCDSWRLLLSPRFKEQKKLATGDVGIVSGGWNSRALFRDDIRGCDFCALPTIYFSRQRSLGESIRAGILAATLLATWFAWSILTFGLHTTLFSNSTSVGTADKTLAQNVEKFFFNCFTTLVPTRFTLRRSCGLIHCGIWAICAITTS